MYEEENTAKIELQRIDHLLYVTLKYSRTGDVMNNIIKRLIDAFELTITEFLEKTKEKNKIKDIPKLTVFKIELLEQLFKKNRVIKDYTNLYYLLKKLDNPNYKSKNEYRKNLTYIINGLEVKAVLLVRFYEKIKTFANFVQYY